MENLKEQLDTDRNIYLVMLKTYAELVNTDPNKILDVLISDKGVHSFIYRDDIGRCFRVQRPEIEMYGKFVLCVRSAYPGQYQPICNPFIWFDKNFIKGEPKLLNRKDLTFV